MVIGWEKGSAPASRFPRLFFLNACVNEGLFLFCFVFFVLFWVFFLFEVGGHKELK